MDKSELLEAVFDHYDMRLPQGSGDRKILCPVHEERKPSASVNVDKGVWHCFSCGAGGSAFDIVMARRALIMIEQLRGFDSMLTQKAVRYAEAYEGSRAQEYMESRGVVGLSARDTFLLGYVPIEGEDARFAGMLSIPYITVAGGVVAIKYRNLRPDADPRYTQPAGQETHLYNVIDLTKPSRSICVCEGEIDALTLSMIGQPAVGVPGVNNFKDHYFRLFDGYDDIVIVADPDDAGDGLARLLTRRLMGSRTVTLPKGSDVNSFYMEHGPEALLKLLGVSR